jgi:hypothetical protein
VVSGVAGADIRNTLPVATVCDEDIFTVPNVLEAGTVIVPTVLPLLLISKLADAAAAVPNLNTDPERPDANMY